MFDSFVFVYLFVCALPIYVCVLVFYKSAERKSRNSIFILKQLDIKF